MTIAYIALGSNLGDSVLNVKMAIQTLGYMDKTKFLVASSLYRSKPIDAMGEDYVNAVVKIETHLNAYELLAKLQKLEIQAGRPSPADRVHLHNAPRTLDMDILLFGQAQIQSATLTVPHPRMAERAFVLLPLQEIGSEYVSADALRLVQNQVILII